MQALSRTLRAHFDVRTLPAEPIYQVRTLPARADVCNATNTTFLGLEKVCIHSDHSGHCGTKGADSWNVVMHSAACTTAVT